ncbi:MAG: DNA mismatch repair endonuclease MutL [Lachnospiraceae bacterium]|nr:DNA mismatch repair endonuclease MutL [Lachnospiraceae bacterium]
MVEKNTIELLNRETIDKIAAGEVVERPASVVKELVENSIDAHANAITVEMKDGGITLLRITDNGDGISHDEIKKAFLRHSTSKIRKVEDLDDIRSLGFRGEALSSISAVSRVELLTKTKDELTGSAYRIEGGEEIDFSEMGTPDGTTFFIRQLFYNTPARKKFLKSPMTEGNYVSEVVEKLAISHPEVAFRLIANGTEKFATAGNGNLKDVIYQIYGRDITKELIEINDETAHFHIHGYIGSPLINRGNRGYESFFVNGRYVKSQTLMRSVEAGYEGFLMQHQYPFAILNLDFSSHEVDVNVHPTKQEVRFQNNDAIGSDLKSLIAYKLKYREDISTVPLTEENHSSKVEVVSKGAEPFETNHLENFKAKIEASILEDKKEYEAEEIRRTYGAISISKDVDEEKPVLHETDNRDAVLQNKNSLVKEEKPTFVQQTFLSEESIKEHRIIGQVFDTYWMVEFDNCLYVIDQHAAHEKVLFERTMEKLKDKEMTSQQISPPIIVSLSETDRNLLFENEESFKRVGYEFSSFGGSEVSLTAIPDNLFGIDAKELFLNTIASLSDIGRSSSPDLILEKVASMSCKAAVKGHDHLSRPEIETLISDLLSLENPYHCPHGRPTIVRLTHYELDKKFKRIL